LTSLVLWFVFITIFSAKLPDGTQFAPYLLAGVLLITFFTQGFNQAADSIAQGSGILMKIYVPPQVFAFAGAVSNAVNFCFGLFALAFISLITGDGISLLAPLTVVVILFMLMYVTGLGLLVSVAYVRYDDTRSIFAILISFMMYLSPIFYPKEILSGTMLNVVNANPLTSFLDVFRYVFSNTGSASWADWVYMGGFSTVILFLGIRSFAKAWPRTVVMM
jgi:ABC-type polysaccharide/polyol phosphate export permease